MLFVIHNNKKTQLFYFILFQSHSMDPIQLTPYPFSVTIDGEKFQDRYDALNYARPLVDDFQLSPTGLNEHIEFTASRDETSKYQAFAEYVYALPPLRFPLDPFEAFDTRNSFFNAKFTNINTKKFGSVNMYLPREGGGDSLSLPTISEALDFKNDSSHLVFHGTILDSAVAIATSGIQVSRGFPFRDFSQAAAFYVGGDFEKAKEFANRKAFRVTRDESFWPAVVVLEYTPESAFRFEDASDDWKKYVWTCRTEEIDATQDLMTETADCHRSDVVHGPMAKNFSQTWESITPILLNNQQLFTQTCFKTNQVVRRQLCVRGIVVLPLPITRNL